MIKKEIFNRRDAKDFSERWKAIGFSHRRRCKPTLKDRPATLQYNVSSSYLHFLCNPYICFCLKNETDYRNYRQQKHHTIGWCGVITPRPTIYTQHHPNSLFSLCGAQESKAWLSLFCYFGFDCFQRAPKLKMFKLH